MNSRHEARFGSTAARIQRPSTAAARAAAGGMTARVAAAHAIAEAVTYARPLDERFAADPRGRGSPARRARSALARSIATVALRRLGTIRKALAERLDKGMPKRAGTLEWIARRRRGADPVSRRRPIMPRSISPCGSRDSTPASAPFAGLANAVLRNIARASARRSSPPPIRSTTTRRPGSQRAGALLTAKRRRAPSPRAHRDEPTLDISVKSDAAGWAERFGGVVLPTGSVRLDSHKADRRPRRLRRRRVVGAGRRRGAAGAAPRRPRRNARRRSLRRARWQERRSSPPPAPASRDRPLGRAAETLAANFERLRARIRRSSSPTRSPSMRRHFDAALLDAPCTATGTIRRHPDVAWIKRPGDLAPLVETAGPASRQGDRADQAGRPHRLLHVLARARGGRGPDRRAASPQSRRAPRADRAERNRRPRRMPHALGRPSHPALPSVGGRPETLRPRRLFRREADEGEIGRICAGQPAHWNGNNECWLAPECSLIHSDPAIAWFWA